MENLFGKSKAAAKSLARLSAEKINEVLLRLADNTIERMYEILDANSRDLSALSTSSPMYDRLKLDRTRLESIADDIRNVASLPSPSGLTLSEHTRPNKMTIRKISVPFGVIGIIYEARPNVSFDVFSLCFKSGNACILKGGSDAENSNRIIVGIIRDTLRECGTDENTVVLMPSGHESVTELLNAVGKVDLVIPRGGRKLIDFVRQNARVPVIETGAGICHTYFDVSGDKEKGIDIIENAKTRRVSVCNALDCLIIHRERLSDLPELCKRLENRRVEIFADEEAYEALSGKYRADLLKNADDESFGTEFLSYKMAVKTVGSIEDAIGHIDRFSSRHSECIIAEDADAIALFEQSVDAACVYSNVSTAFTDGGQFGFGAEIGISTQKLHARGPMALPELTTYKYIISGNGQTRP